MKVVVQKCRDGKVCVANHVTGKCSFGLLVFVGFTEQDSKDTIRWMANKIAHLRIFEDESHCMNKSILDVGGTILSVSQFTLYGDATKGNRPSYIKALQSEEAKKLYDIFNETLRTYCEVETGIFGADMEVSFTNLGPTTILLEK